MSKKMMSDALKGKLAIVGLTDEDALTKLADMGLTDEGKLKYLNMERLTKADVPEIEAEEILEKLGLTKQVVSPAVPNPASPVPPAAPGPILVFLHGTGSSTKGSFSELWDPKNASGAVLRARLKGVYGDRVYALEHRSLTESPIQNALQLVERLPEGAELHLVEPLGFDLSEPKLRRAGLDYHDLASVTVHPDLPTAWQVLMPARVFAFTAHANSSFADVAYQGDDVLMFGPEPTGLDAETLADPHISAQLRIPMLAGRRSLNLSNAAAVAPSPPSRPWPARRPMPLPPDRSVNSARSHHPH